MMSYVANQLIVKLYWFVRPFFNFM